MQSEGRRCAAGRWAAPRAGRPRLGGGRSSFFALSLIHYLDPRVVAHLHFVPFLLMLFAWRWAGRPRLGGGRSSSHLNAKITNI